MFEKKSIVMIASYGGPYAGNFIPSLIAYDNVIKQMGFRTVYIFPDFVEKYAWVETMRNISDSIYFIPYNPYSYDNIRRIRKICKLEHAILLYSRMTGWDITGRFAMPGLPMIWHMEMDLSLPDWKQKCKYFLKYRILSGSNVYHISVSESTAKTINSLGVWHKCVWIPNAINLERIEKKPVLPFNNPVRLLCFAYQPVIKGFDIALDACEILNKYSVKYILMASAQKNTYAYVAERYGDNPPDWLELLEPTDKISEIFNKADILLSTSRSEGLSFANLEGLYSGLPVVYSEIPGNKLLADFACTHSFESCNSGDLAAKIEQCVAEGADATGAKKNQLMIEEKFTMPAWKEIIEDFIQAII